MMVDIGVLMMMFCCLAMASMRFNVFNVNE